MTCTNATSSEAFTYDDVAPAAWPPDCPVSLDQLLQEKHAALEELLRVAS
jgi:hypothetical protein